MYKSIPKFQLQIYNKFILFLTPLWWEILVLISLVRFSDLELSSSLKSNLYTTIFIPVILFLFPFLTKKFILKDKKLTTFEKLKLSNLNILFFLFLIISLIQFLKSGVPGLSTNPDLARTEWDLNIKLQILTEIIFRTSFLLTIGKIIIKEKLKISSKIIIFYVLLYSILSSARSFFLECLFYIFIAYLIKSETINFLKENSLVFYKNIIKAIKRNFIYIFFGINLFFIFIILGELRMRGEEFNAFEYSQADINIPLFLQPIVSWLWGYLVANMHNLRLIIDENFKNEAFSNVAGPLLSAFQIMDYVEVDSFIYIGKYNLGTALRPWIVDFGAEIGIIIFGFIWSLITLIPEKTKNIHLRSSLLILIIYFGLMIPITSRIQIIPFLVPMLILMFLDKIRGFNIFYKK